MGFLAGTVIAEWLLYRVFRFRRLFRQKGQVEETRESLFSWSRANQDLSGLISDWLNGLATARKE